MTNDHDHAERHEGHRERLRNRIMRNGLDALAPHEVVEFLLYYAIPRQDVNALAHRLLKRFENIQGLLGADLDELMQVDGMSEPVARWIQLLQSNVDACAEAAQQEKCILKNYAAVFHYALLQKSKYRPPCAVQLCLDREGRPLYQSAFCLSPRWGEPEAFQEALNDAICSEAKDVILLIYTHQHTPVASFYDITHARAYLKLMHAASCSLLDVVLVGEKHLSSLRRSGLITGQGKGNWSLALHEDYLRNMPEGDAFPVEDYANFSIEEI